ncbi:MAG: radical SAM protein [Egibacteraceae bacterium]
MRDVTLLWALRSPCNLGCRYCYFGTVEEHRLTSPDQPGQLSHISRGDLSFADIEAFLRTIGDSAVKRVFLAGGEPLIWPHTLTVVEILEAAEVQVVICTNGIPLNRPEISERIVAVGVDGVSVSLDSIDAKYNDRYRPSRNGIQGWSDVVSGIRRLIDARADQPVPRVGLYTVITRCNIPAVREVAAFGSELGLDYYVPQPVSLAPAHPLHDELSLRENDVPALIAALDDLYQAGLLIRLPDRSYAHQFVTAITTHTPGFVTSCFGGHTLFFIEPDGSVWDCPSSSKIAATQPSRHCTIRGRHAAELFGTTRRTCANGCDMFSKDCVNMWPLMGFDRLLHRGQVG